MTPKELSEKLKHWCGMSDGTKDDYYEFVEAFEMLTDTERGDVIKYLIHLEKYLIHLERSLRRSK